jgi:hypothetical protein
MRFPAAAIFRESQSGAAGVFGFSVGPLVLSHSDRENRPRAGGSLFVKSAGAIVKASCAALMLSGCFGQKHTLRYRLTLAVNVDGALHTGSSVIEDTFIDQVALAGAGGMPWATHLRGEAVAVDLGLRGVLFCTLVRDPERRTSRDAELLPIRVFADYFPDGFPVPDSGKFASQINNLVRHKPKHDIDLAMLPMLVRFRSPADPASVERIEPRDLTAKFGPGSTLVSATMEITDVPVTTGITDYLTWLKTGSEEEGLLPQRGEPVTNLPPEYVLTYRHFKRVTK